MTKIRDEIDLFYALNDPVRARKYIAEFNWGNLEPITEIQFEDEPKIEFDKMSDVDAVAIARWLLNNIDIPRELTESKLARYEH